MTTFYVATLARYVVVDAANETEARTLAIPALQAVQPGRTAPIEIRTVRPATEDEIELMNWHREMTEDPAPDASDWV